MHPSDRAYRQLHLRVTRWEEGAKYTRANVLTPAALRVEEDRYLLLGTIVEGGAVATAAMAPISTLRMNRQRSPTPGASIVLDFGEDSQWLIDFFWPQVVAASTNRAGRLVNWRVLWNSNRPIKTTRGAHRRRQVFIDTMVAKGATLLP
jgi:hypothetical protein